MLHEMKQQTQRKTQTNSFFNKYTQENARIIYTIFTIYIRTIIFLYKIEKSY